MNLVSSMALILGVIAIAGFVAQASSAQTEVVEEKN
jgi:hypothetical protein